MKLRWLVFITLIGLTVWFRQDSLRTGLKQFAERAGIVRRLDEHTISHSYLARDDAWLTFSLPARCESIRVLTNANVRPALLSLAAEGVEWKYALKYELLDASNASLSVSEYHFRVRPGQFHDPATKEPCSPSFYADENVVPTRTNEFRVPLLRVTTAARRVRVRLLRADEPLTDIGIRIYAEEQRPNYKIKRLWQRTSLARRERLSRASVYSPDLLADSERTNLLRRAWLPIAPNGVEGRDYERRILYTLKDFRGVEVGQDQAPPGQLATPELEAVIEMPDEAGFVRLECTMLTNRATPARLARLPETEATPSSATRSRSGAPNARETLVTVRWFGESIHDRLEQSAVLTSKSTVLEMATGSGLLVVSSTEPIAIRSRWNRTGRGDDEAWLDITPQPTIVRVFDAAPDSCLQYKIDHVEDQSTPLRIDVRHLETESARSSAKGAASGRPAFGPVNWRLVDRSGAEVASGTLESQQVWSRYDRVHGVGVEIERMSEPERFYLAAPPSAVTLQFDGAERSVVSCYSRPAALPRQMRIPTADPLLGDSQSQSRTWFPLRPTNYQDRINRQKTRLIVIQPRPPEDNPLMAAGRYQWKSYPPEGGSTARYVMLPREADSEIRPEAASSTFLTLETNRTHRLTFFADPGESSVRPLLVYRRTSEEAATLSVVVNGGLPQLFQLTNRCGELQLNPFVLSDSDQAELRFDTSDEMQVMLSQVSDEGPRHLKRFAYRAAKETLRFAYEKETAGEELLVLQIFKSGMRPAERWSVSIETDVVREIGPHRNWTVLNRTLELAPADSTSAFVLTDSMPAVGDNYYCYLPLGEDLPSGHFQISISREGDDDAYIVLSKTTPGDFSRRRVFRTPRADISRIEEGPR